MNSRAMTSAIAAACLATLLAACASTPAPKVLRQGVHTPQTLQTHPAGDTGIQTRSLSETEDQDGMPRAQIRRGTGETINYGAASASLPNLGGTTGEATFNFEGESVQAVVKAILGDMLGQNYVIAPGVQGTVTLSTPKPVSPASALSLLEMVLGWNNARMVYSDGRYNIVASDQAMATGAVAPRTGPASSARGFEARTISLRYISASEMEKLLKPYARPNAIVTVDNGRNIITVSGSRSELENYMRTIQIFDVDWMSSMSVGVFPLQSGKAAKVVSDLEKVFGEQSKSPVAGMFRFMPLEGANAVLVITSQPNYLDDIQQWVERIDGAGDGVRLHSYELKYITAKDLAERLAEVYGAQRSSSSSSGPSLMPGLSSTTIQDEGIESDGTSSAMLGGEGSEGFGSSSGGGLGSGSLSLGEREGGDTTVSLEVDGSQVGVSAVDETNSLLVRAGPSAWSSIKEVIDKLDIMPLQVHIEAQVAEVTLSGDLSYGVDWYFGNKANPALTLGQDSWATVGGSLVSPTPGGIGWTFARSNGVAVITALDKVSDVQILQSPSLLVRNNFEASLNVGSRIPITSVTINPGGGEDTPYSQVQYLDTGTILKVRPRVTRDGTVFLDIVQEVSSPAGPPDQNGNVRIDTRRLKTNAVVQSGDTVMLAGLIRDDTTRGSSGLPGLSRIPVVGGLFGRQVQSKSRSEVIVLLTPTLVRDVKEARDLTDEYGRRFRSLEPLYRKP